jgi:hypothetical protein
VRVDLPLVFNYFSAYPHEIRGGPCKNITVLIKELLELHLLLWTHFSANVDNFIWYPRVECHSLDIAFSLNCFLEFYRGLLLGQRLCLLMLLCVFSYEMHIFVARGEATLDVSGFFLTLEYCYDVEGGWDLEAGVP